MLITLYCNPFFAPCKEKIYEIPGFFQSIFERKPKKAEEEGRGDKEWAHPGNDTYILVFDYDLNLVKSFRSDCDIINLAVTTDPEVVYATDLRENRLVKYTLRGL